MKKVAFYILFSFFCLGIFFSQKINVFDTLLSHHMFSHVEHEKKNDYYLKKDKTLERKVFLTSDILHYHKSHEDSMYYFLKKAYGDSFSGLTFIAGENIEWKTENGNKFGWKKGEKISKSKLDKVYSTLNEIYCLPHRTDFLQGEEKNHFFYYHNYLLDSVENKIFCYNRPNGLPNGKIDFLVNGKIIKETGFYENGKIFYDYDGNTFSVFSSQGDKIYFCDEKRIIGFILNGNWEFNREKNEFTAKGPVKNINDYYKEIYFLWKKAMRE